MIYNNHTFKYNFILIFFSYLLLYNQNIRVAWGKNDNNNRSGLTPVEVTAHQIPSRFKSTTKRSGKDCLATDLSILYSRQELAERLRLAWKHREENKANIDIFLAHGMENCDSELSISVSPTPSSIKDSEYVQDDVSWHMKISNVGLHQKEICEFDNKNEKECEKILETKHQVEIQCKNIISAVENEEERQNKVYI